MRTSFHTAADESTHWTRQDSFLSQSLTPGIPALSPSNTLAQNTDLLAEFSHGLLLQPVGLFATEHPLTMENSFNFYVYNKRLGK